MRSRAMPAWFTFQVWLPVREGLGIQSATSLPDWVLRISTLKALKSLEPPMASHWVQLKLTVRRQCWADAGMVNDGSQPSLLVLSKDSRTLDLGDALAGRAGTR